MVTIKGQANAGSSPRKFSQNMSGGRLAGVDAPGPIDRHALRQRAFDRPADGAVPGAAEVDARLVLDVGDVDRVVGRNEQATRPAELRPLLEILAVLVEDLDTLVAAIGHEH